MGRLLSPDLPVKTLWRNLDSIGLRDRENASVNVDPNRLNEYFSSVNTGPTPLTRPPSTGSVFDFPAFSFRCVTPKEVFDSIYHIKSDSVGLDGVPLKFVKLVIGSVLPLITYIFNSSITSGSFPTEWRISKIIPVAKIPDPLEPKDYRPISILPSLSKALELVMRDQIVDYIESHNLLSPYQSGFRTGHSTVTALLNITDDIYRDLDEGLFVALVLLDFSKAFDTVNHALLCQKLRTFFNFSSNAISFIESYLTFRVQCVGVDGLFSEFLPVISGVPQGSVLGPLLFSLFINDLCRVVHFARYHAYADDFQLYSGGCYGDVSNCILRLNGDLERVYRWSLDNGLVLNGSKTQAIIFSRSMGRLPNPLPELTLGGEAIAYSACVKNLGVFMDDRLTWRNHVDHVRKNVNFVLSRLWHFADVTPVETRRRLVQSLAIPLFLYCDVVFSQSSADVNRRLNITYNSCARYIYGISRYQSISEYSRRIIGVSYDTLMDLRKCMMIYRVLNGQAPGYLCDRVRRARSTRTMNLIIPNYNTTHRSASFFVQGANKWNNVPPVIKVSPSVASFRESFLSHFGRTVD
jgi:hypothetical protein